MNLEFSMEEIMKLEKVSEITNTKERNSAALISFQYRANKQNWNWFSRTPENSVKSMNKKLSRKPELVVSKR